jgi:uncharacterized protein YjbI with pentapeptide repeats
MTTSIKFIIVITVAATILFITLGGAKAMNIFKNEFEQKWEELSRDVKKLNEYTALHPVELKGVKITERKIDGAIFSGAKFSGVEWESSTSKNSTFSKVVFENCKFIQSDFSYSTFTDVVFKGCEFMDADINRSTLVGVRFEGCKFKQMGLVENKGDTLRLVNCDVLDSGLGDSTIDFEIKDCTLDGVDVSTTNGGRKVLIEGGLLSEVDFGDSHFSDVILRRVKQGEGGVYFNSVTAKSIHFEDVEMLGGTGIGYATVGTVTISGGQIYGPAFKDSHIAKTYIRDAFVTCFAPGNMGVIHVSNSTLHDSGLFRGIVEEFSVHNSNIDEIAGKNFKADIVIWDNVTLDGKIDLTNAHIKDFRPTRLKRGPCLQLITTGSNIRF